MQVKFSQEIEEWVFVRDCTDFLGRYLHVVDGRFNSFPVPCQFVGRRDILNLCVGFGREDFLQFSDNSWSADKAVSGQEVMLQVDEVLSSSIQKKVMKLNSKKIKCE